MPETMNLLWTQEQEMLSKAARKFAMQHGPVARLRDLRKQPESIGFDRDAWSQIAELGWAGLIIPESYGGSELGIAELGVVLEETGRTLMPEPILSCALAAFLIAKAGSDAQKNKWLPDIASGKKIATLAWFEPGHAADPVHIESRLKHTKDGFVLDGIKVQVEAGSAADLFLVVAHDTEGPVFFAIERERKGVSITPQQRLDLHGIASVTFEQVKLTQNDMIGDADHGAKLLGALIDRASVLNAAQSLGGAEQAFAMTIQYLKDRVQFDRPIGSFQALQHRAARLYTEIATSRSAVVAAARAIDDSRTEASRFASLAKVLTSETFVHVAKEAIQMHGGIGMTDEHDIGFYLKRAQVNSALYGEPSWHRSRWASLSNY